MIRTLDIGGHTVAVAEAGAGEPLLYLHGFADIHASTDDWLPVHRLLAGKHCILAPAHPGCHRSEESEDIETIEDVVFHYLEVLDALRVERFHLAGASIGGWIAAEIAVRIPERIRSLALIGATGLYVPQHPIADIFMLVQPRNGGDYSDYRRVLFGDAAGPEALGMFPDGRMTADRELLRYRMFRFASRIGFAPPYLYDRKLRQRLHRFGGPAAVIAGEKDGLVPVAHARAYADGLRQARLELVTGAGNSVAVEKPEAVATAMLVCADRAGVSMAVPP